MTGMMPAAGGGARQMPDNPHLGELAPGGSVGTSPGNEPPRWQPGMILYPDLSVPAPRPDEDVPTADDGDLTGTEREPSIPNDSDLQGPGTEKWPEGGHGTQQAGIWSVGGATGIAPSSSALLSMGLQSPGETHLRPPNHGEVMDTDMEKRDFSDADRKRLASEGKALPDGSYPVETEEDLHNAAAHIRMGHGDTGAARRLVARRAKDLNVANPLEAAAKFSASQSRAPAGSASGGQFDSGSASSSGGKKPKTGKKPKKPKPDAHQLHQLHEEHLARLHSEHEAHESHLTREGSQKMMTEWTNTSTGIGSGDQNGSIRHPLLGIFAAARSMLAQGHYTHPQAGVDSGMMDYQARFEPKPVATLTHTVGAGPIEQAIRCQNSMVMLSIQNQAAAASPFMMSQLGDRAPTGDPSRATPQPAMLPAPTPARDTSRGAESTQPMSVKFSEYTTRIAGNPA